MIDASEIQGRDRVMLVDDEETCAVLLEMALGEEFEVLWVASGEACLQQVAEFAPAVILLDIEMGGMDGYETCRRIRAEEGLPQPAVLFVSSHELLEERLKAYESGGDDFVVKPALPAEIVRKARAMVRLVGERKALKAQCDAVQAMAMGFLTNLGESGTALQFLRNAPNYASLRELAGSVLDALRDYRLDGAVQLRHAGEILTLDASGLASPLQESIFGSVRSLERIFQFRQRLIINYPHVSLLVLDLPVDDEARSGRLRDLLAIIAEGCDVNLRAMIRNVEFEKRTRQLERVSAAVRDSIEELRGQYRRQQSATQAILQRLNEHFADDLMHLGLSDVQDDRLQALLSSSLNEALDLFQGGLDFDAHFGRLLEELDQA